MIVVNTSLKCSIADIVSPWLVPYLHYFLSCAEASQKICNNVFIVMNNLDSLVHASITLLVEYEYVVCLQASYRLP